MKNQVGKDYWPITTGDPEREFPGIVFHDPNEKDEFDPVEGRKHPWFTDNYHNNPNVLLSYLLGDGYEQIDFGYSFDSEKGKEIIVTNGIVSLKVLTWQGYDPEETWYQFIIMPA